MAKAIVPAVIFALAANVSVAAADEIDDLAGRLTPPQRFAAHTPDFRVVERTFTFEHVGGPQQRAWRLVMDGRKYVALLRSGDVILLALTPDHASAHLAMPTGRYHLDTLQGPSLPTHPFIQTKVNYTLQGASNVDETDRFEGGGRTLTLVRHDADDHRSVTNRFRFTCDPVFGYCVDGVYEVAFKELPPPKKRKFPSGTFCPGCYVPWPEAWVYDRTVYCPAGTDAYVGWANNLVAMDRADARKDTFTWRDGGFIAYLNRKTGWSVVRTRDDGTPPPRMGLCNAHNDFHIGIPFPEEMTRDADGWYRLRFHHRLMGLPPELTQHVWDHMTLNEEGRRAVMIRIGVLEDFEDQPVDLTRPVRGLCWTSGAPKVTTDAARSGKQALLLEKTSWPNLPQVSLEPNARYRLEAWLKVEGDGTTAWLKGDFYEWSPHKRTWLKEQKTNTVQAGLGWVRSVLEFDTPAWDPFINIVFCVGGEGKAYLDDFQLVRVDTPP
jgi:hypothetical protein